MSEDKLFVSLGCSYKCVPFSDLRTAKQSGVVAAVAAQFDKILRRKSTKEADRIARNDLTAANLANDEISVREELVTCLLHVRSLLPSSNHSDGLVLAEGRRRRRRREAADGYASQQASQPLSRHDRLPNLLTVLVHLFTRIFCSVPGILLITGSSGVFSSEPSADNRDRFIKKLGRMVDKSVILNVETRGSREIDWTDVKVNLFTEFNVRGEVKTDGVLF